jgi:hypothetical protein
MRRAVVVWLAGILMVPVTGTAAAPAASTADRAERPRIHVGPVREVFDGSRRASARWLVAAMGQDNVATVGFPTARFSTNSSTEGFFTADVPGPAGLSPIVGDDPRLFLAEDDPPQLAADQAGNMTALWDQTAHDPDTGDVDFRETMTAYRPVGASGRLHSRSARGFATSQCPSLR